MNGRAAAAPPPNWPRLQRRESGARLDDQVPQRNDLAAAVL